MNGRMELRKVVSVIRRLVNTDFVLVEVPSMGLKKSDKPMVRCTHSQSGLQCD